ncbi:TatD family hydrolase [Paenibacillus pinistramenti]|uniref:TatD family hydrolase n=1 Tax=Paenibacillus pinistramenti TaxID=1768003 RepID=UPI001109E957|nr:TatD family hydrolase [Paenibacillus pinistramenti]
MIDAHIHLEQYSDEDIAAMAAEAEKDGIQGLVAVSMNLESCLRTAELAARYPALVKPAYGFHPEQPVPAAAELDRLLAWIRRHAGAMTAVGEIGLPYYLRSEKEQAGEHFELQPYIEVLERFLALAAELDKPVVLHAVYEDAEVVCGLLEKHRIERAHFHWFKGPEKTVRRMAERGYFISFTPDILYEEEIRGLAHMYPPELVMAETDGPWPFEGPFEGQPTHPRMIHSAARAWAEIHGWTYEEACLRLEANTRSFYRI